ncbi:MAG: tRNA (cytidine(34)-2'-O)-methyltransferase [Pirellulales bacterium]|jgi:tRNA (cytidine/uridine-2'-O-)-methyltransferase
MRYDPLLHVVLNEPEIPPNTGNIARTCVAIGAKLWLVEPVAFRLDDASLKRAGLDYWPELEWEVVANWQRLLERLGERRMWLFSARATRCYTDVSFHRGDAVVFGSETRGLPQEVMAANAEKLLTIPSRPQVRSLNLSNAAAIVCYEAVRQWGGLASGTAAVTGAAGSRGNSP